MRKLSKKEKKSLRCLGKLPRARKQMEHSRRIMNRLGWPSGGENAPRLRWGAASQIRWGFRW